MNRFYGTTDDDWGYAIAADLSTNSFFISGVTYGKINGMDNKGNGDVFIMRIDDMGLVVNTWIIGTKGKDMIGAGKIITLCNEIMKLN